MTLFQFLVAVYFFCFSQLSLAGSVTADGPITVISNPASVDYKNMTEIMLFMQAMGEDEAARDIGTALAAGKVSYGPNLKYDGERVLGLTMPLLDLYFSEELVSPVLPISILKPTTDTQLETALRLFNVAIHERYHYQDFEDSLGYGVVVGENITYKRSHMDYTHFLRQMFEKYQALESANDPQAGHWYKMIAIYAYILGGEFLDYNFGLYGEIDDSYVPMAVHSGCVKHLKRHDYGMYLTHMTTALLSQSGTRQDSMKKFDSLARFYYGEGSNRCLREMSMQLPPLPTYTMGYGAPRLRQEVIEIKRHTNGRMIRVKKKGIGSGEVEIYAVATRADIEGFNLQQFGEMSYYENSEIFVYPKSTNRIYLIVSEKNIGSYPETGLEIELSEEWYDENNIRRSVPLISEQLPAEMQSHIGLFPAVRKEITANFTVDSHFSFEYLHSQITGVQFEALKGQRIHLRVPIFDGRMVKIYRVTPGADGLHALTHFAYMGEDIDSRELPIDATGKYFIIVERLYSRRSATSFKINLEISNTGAKEKAPADVPVIPLSDADYLKLKSHKGHSESMRIDLRTKDLNVGWTSHYSTTGFSAVFAPFQVIELNVRKGDVFNVLPLPGLKNVHVTLYAQDAQGKMRNVLPIYPMGDNLVEVRTDEKYFMIFESAFPEPIGQTTLVNIEFRAKDRQGPSSRKPRLLSVEDVKQKFGIYGYFESNHDTDLITAAHPQEFLFKKTYYQIYQIQVPDDILLEINHGQGGVDRWFILAEVDSESWSQNKAALKAIYSSRALLNSKSYVRVPKGVHYFAIETHYMAGFGSTPFFLRWAFNRTTPGNLLIKKLTAVEMADPRMKVLK